MGTWHSQASGESFSAVKVADISPNDHWSQGGVLLRLGDDYPYEPWRGQSRAFNNADGHFEEMT